MIEFLGLPSYTVTVPPFARSLAHSHPDCRTSKKEICTTAHPPVPQHIATYRLLSDGDTETHISQLPATWARHLHYLHHRDRLKKQLQPLMYVFAASTTWQPSVQYSPMTYRSRARKGK